MHLRNLEEKDAPFMLEWMQDESVVEHLQTRFTEKTIEDCLAFIAGSSHDKEDLHLAIADEKDEYLGTVSLKHMKDGAAEFGIAIRRCAMGSGIAKAAMEQILYLGAEKKQIQRVYWCVDPKNLRALRFYDKNGYARVQPEDAALSRMLAEAGAYTKEQIEAYVWYQMSLRRQS